MTWKETEMAEYFKRSEVPEDLARFLAQMMDDADEAERRFRRAERWYHMATGGLMVALLANVVALIMYLVKG